MVNYISRGKHRALLLIISIVLVIMVVGLSIYAGAKSKYEKAPIEGVSIGELNAFLRPYMTYEHVDGRPEVIYDPYNQRSYLLPNLEGFNEGCGVVSNAIGRSIISKRGEDPNSSFFNWGTSQNPAASNDASLVDKKITITGTQAELKTIYNTIKNGKPIRMYKNDTRGNQHFVVVCGYYSGTNPSGYLSFDNFVCMDPNTGTLVRLTDSWSWSDYPATEISYRVFK